MMKTYTRHSILVKGGRIEGDRVSSGVPKKILNDSKQSFLTLTFPKYFYDCLFNVIFIQAFKQRKSDLKGILVFFQYKE